MSTVTCFRLFFRSLLVCLSVQVRRAGDLRAEQRVHTDLDRGQRRGIFLGVVLFWYWLARKWAGMRRRIREPPAIGTRNLVACFWELYSGAGGSLFNPSNPNDRQPMASREANRGVRCYVGVRLDCVLHVAIGAGISIWVKGTPVTTTNTVMDPRTMVADLWRYRTFAVLR